MKGHHSQFQSHWIWYNNAMKISLLILSAICLGGSPGCKGLDISGLTGARDGALENENMLETREGMDYNLCIKIQTQNNKVTKLCKNKITFIIEPKSCVSKHH